MGFVQKTEESKGLSPLLSAVLGDKAGNDFSAAMNLHGEGRFAEYCKIMDIYQERWVGGVGRPDISAAADTSKAARGVTPLSIAGGIAQSVCGLD